MRALWSLVQTVVGLAVVLCLLDAGGLKAAGDPVGGELVFLGSGLLCVYGLLCYAEGVHRAR